MPSLWELLSRTMPFWAQQAEAKLNKRQPHELTSAEVRRNVTLLPEQAAFYVELPNIHPEIPREDQRLWAFTYSTARPAEVGSVYCRVHDADYVGHHVAERIAWGLEDPGGLLRQEIRVKFQSGVDLRFPLTSEYLLWAFRVRGGLIRDWPSTLWQLTSRLDTSIVAVFLYDIDPATGQLTKTDFEKVQDPRLREDLREMSRAVKELGSVADNPVEPLESEEDDPVPPPPPEQEGWGTRVLRGSDFWPDPAEQGTTAPAVPVGIGGVVGQSVDIHTEPARVLVVFSFTTCCERADFEPGAMVGFARCYPHLLVSSTAPIALIEGSAHIDRPQALSKWHEKDRDMSASCCKPPHDGWTPQIGSLLVTDANDNPNTVSPFPLPFWSNMFHYYMVDPFLKEGSRRYHVVRTDRRDARDSVVPLVRREVVWLAGEADDPEGAAMEKGIVRKEARQGMFDNIHMAPRLRLMNVTEVGDTDPHHLIQPRFPIDDRTKWHLDDIAMAPFCAHDCLHLHWRWGTTAETKWSLGWDSTGPYRVAGAPMVPKEQDVWVWFRGRASITYHVNATKPQPCDGWHVLMHHGFGYAVAVLDSWPWQAGAAMFAVDGSSRVYFLDSAGEVVWASHSTAVYYWTARYAYSIIDGKAVPRERLSFPSEDRLNEAIDL